MQLNWQVQTVVQRSGEQQQRPFSERGKQSPVDFSESPHGVGTSRLSEQRRRIAFPLKDLFSVIPGRVAFSLPPPAGLLRKEVLRKRKQAACSTSLWATFPQVSACRSPRLVIQEPAHSPATPALAWLLALTAGSRLHPGGSSGL